MMLKAFALLSGAAACAASAAVPGKTVQIAPGVEMPSVSLGTCCGSTPKAGLQGWLDAGGRGIDTALNYGDQPDIAEILAKNPHISREELFLTSKVPGGLGGGAYCNATTAAHAAYTGVLEDVKQLNVTQVDLVLLHAPCEDADANDEAWKGLQQAMREKLTRAIGVSNFNYKQLAALKGAVPSVNQCRMNPDYHDENTIEYCAEHKIQYQAWEALKGCYTDRQAVKDAAANHKKSPQQVCLRWILQRGAIMAVGTGSSEATAKQYAEEDLDVFDFELSEVEMNLITEG